MKKAIVENIDLDTESRTIILRISAKDSRYVEESQSGRFPYLQNAGPLIEGVNHVLEFGYEAVNAMKGNTHFMDLANRNRELEANIKDSNLAARCRQLLSSLDYDKLSDFQAKCALLLEKELK